MKNDTPFTRRGVRRKIARGSTALLAFMMVGAASLIAQVSSTWQSRDIGAVAAAGNAIESGGVVTLRGSGQDIWEGSDEFHYRYVMLTGDGEIMARVTSLENTDGWAKAGVMIRESLEPGARNAFALITPQQVSAVQYRDTPTGGTHFPYSATFGSGEMWCRIIRRGSNIGVYLSADGTAWQATTVMLTLPATAYVGLAVTSHRDGTLCRAVFDHVTVRAEADDPTTPPAAPSNVAAVALSPTEIRVTWTDHSTDETGFDVDRSTDGVHFSEFMTADQNDTEIVDNGRMPATTYYYRIRAVRNTGFSLLTSAYANPASVTTWSGPTVDARWESRDIGAVGAAGSSVMARDEVVTVRGSGRDIGGVADEFHYRYRMMSGNFELEAQVHAIDNTDPQAKVGIMLRAGLEADAPNFFLYFNPAFTAAVQLRTAPGALTSVSPPRDIFPDTWLYVIRSGNHFIAFANSDVIGDFYLDWPDTLAVGIAITSHRNGVVANAELTDVNEYSHDSPATVLTPAIKVTPFSSNIIDVSWDYTPARGMAFELERSLDGTNFPFATTLASSNRHYSDTGLSTTQTYYYRLRVRDGSRYSAYSPVVSARPRSTTIPEAPAGLSADPWSPSEIRLRWTDLSGDETGFEVQRSIDGATFGPAAGNAAANENAITDTGLAAGTRYYYRVRALRGASTSAWSNIASTVTLTTPTPEPDAWQSLDVGLPRMAGQTNASGTTVTLAGGGIDIWERRDEFRFHSRLIASNGEIYARVAAMDNTDPWAKAGVMMRASTDAAADNVFLGVTPQGLVVLQRRNSAGGETVLHAAKNVAAPVWLKLTRAANTFSGYYSGDGTRWVLVGEIMLGMTQNFRAGLAVTSHDENVLCVATFTDVELGGGVADPGTPPAAPSGLSGGATASTTVALAWADNSTNETGFEIERSTDGIGFARLSLNPAGGRTYTDGTVANGGTYYYRVRAVIEPENYSAYSNVLQVVVATVQENWSGSMIGNYGLPGHLDAGPSHVTLTASGEDIWSTADGFMFAQKRLVGDGEIIARVGNLQDTHGWAKAGLMIRESLGPGARHAFVYLTPSNGAGFHSRTTAGGATSITGGPWWASAPYWLRLVREGDTFRAYASDNGSSWSLIATETVAMGTDVRIGFAVCAHDIAQLNTAAFTDVQVRFGAP